MNAFKRWGWLALALACAVGQAAELSEEGSFLRVTGPLSGENAQAFANQLATGRFRTVVLEDSTGGLPEVAERYAQAVRAAGVSTEARGQCHEACAYVFLAGKTHRFGRGPQFHSLLVPLASRMPADALEKTLVDYHAAADAPSPAWPPAQGLLLTSTATLFGRVYKTAWCDGTQGRDLSRCEALEGVDPVKRGLLSPP